MDPRERARIREEMARIYEVPRIREIVGRIVNLELRPGEHIKQADFVGHDRAALTGFDQEVLSTRPAPKREKATPRRDSRDAGAEHPSSTPAASPALRRRMPKEAGKVSGLSDIAAAKAAFDRIVLAYPPQEAAIDALDEVRLSYLGRPEEAPCGGAMMIAPMGSGKTVSIQRLARRVVAAGGLPEGSIPILHVVMPTEGTTDAIPTAILSALGMPRPDLGRASLRWIKAVRGMREAHVQLVVFDEFNRANRRPTMSRPIATTIREKIMDRGVAPVAIVGSEEAGLVLKACPELAERLDDRIPLQPLEWFDDQDRDILLRLLAELDTAMVAAGLVGSSGLADEAIAAPLAGASGGRIRSLMKIVRITLGLSMERGATAIGVADLEEAVDRFAVSAGFIDRNPFTVRRST